MDNRSEHGEDGADRRSAALIGLIIILALAIAGVVLVRELRERSRLEDCLMAGPTHAAPIEARQHAQHPSRQLGAAAKNPGIAAAGDSYRLSMIDFLVLKSAW